MIQKQLFTLSLGVAALAAAGSTEELAFVSVNVSFNYAGLASTKALQGLEGTRSILRNIFSKASDYREIQDAAFPDPSKSGPEIKAKFLADIAEKSQGSEIVNFNFIGHGRKGTDGNWYLVLPVSGGENRANLIPQMSSAGNVEEVRNQSRWQEAIELLDVSKPQATDGVVSLDEILRVLASVGVKKVFGVLEAGFSGQCVYMTSAFKASGLSYSFIYSSEKNEIAHHGLLTHIHLADKRRLDLDGDRLVTWGEMRRRSQGRINRGADHEMMGSFGKRDEDLDKLLISDAI